ncbi:MAG: flagellar basal body rod protein FlgC [Halieaceae bacterium]|jgi:flagellar basal-body rod protein FlgC|nr:flagellar basal body rod protein FlgC [Halieaceae bacterium]
MSLFDAMNIAGTALDAQTVRLNTIASNMANAHTVAGSAEEAYRAKAPVFSAVLEDSMNGDGSQMGVRVDQIVQTGAEPYQEYNPGHPLADENGFIYRPSINTTTEMANMMQASRSFQNAIETMNTAKQLALRTLTLGK